MISDFQIVGNFGELGEIGLEVFDDFGGGDVGIGELHALRAFSRSEAVLQQKKSHDLRSIYRENRIDRAFAH